MRMKNYWKILAALGVACGLAGCGTAAESTKTTETVKIESASSEAQETQNEAKKRPKEV